MTRHTRSLRFQPKSSGKNRKLRVAAYARVSSSSNDQLNSFGAQNRYYTDLIASKESWVLVDIYADEGITGTSALKRDNFQLMLADCSRGLIDRVLVKSISRFARNTVDCLNYIRILRELGIAVIFEKENINTLESNSELLITLLGAFAQAESESISANVLWGKRQAMREGKANIQYKKLYAFEKGADGNLQIILEQAEVVRQIYRQFLLRMSLRMIKQELEEEHIPTVAGGPIVEQTQKYSININAACPPPLQVKRMVTVIALQNEQSMQSHSVDGIYYKI